MKIPDLLIPQKYPKREMGGKMDYQEKRDVSQIHAAAEREKQEPRHPVEGAEPLPLWLLVMIILAVFWGGGYLLLFSGGFRPDVIDERTTSAAMFFPERRAAGEAGPEAAREQDVMALGKRYYGQYCQQCHQREGQGGGQYPPLAGSEWVVEGDKRLALIILYGLEGPITVKGQGYGALPMPAWGGSLNDKQVAAIMTYVRNSWGNQAPPVTAEAVAAARQEFAGRTQPLTADQLQQIPADAILPGAAPAEEQPQPGAPSAEAGI